MHLLEDHVVDELTSFKAGLGKLNEEGGEASHHEQNKDARRAHNLKQQPQKRMEFFIKTHLVNHHPDVQAKSLKSRKRKHED